MIERTATPAATEPTVVDALADLRFRALAEGRGLDPDARFVGGYVAWEWRHARHVFESSASIAPIAGRTALELGCNVGATAIVLASLGARVTAVDRDPFILPIARANAARHGVEATITFEHVTDSAHLPFADASFDVASCNSVLEYIEEAALDGVLRELDRVLRPGGILIVLGTSNRLWPRETHSRRWLVNYLPRALDRVIPGAPLRRGISAGRVRRALPGYRDLVAEDGGRRFVELKRRMGARGLWLAALGAGAALAARAGLSPGALGPSLTMLLQKPQGCGSSRAVDEREPWPGGARIWSRSRRAAPK